MKEHKGAKITLPRTSEARKDILKRILELNHKIRAEEVAKGLWEKKGKKSKVKSSKVNEPGINYNQEQMFGERD